MNQRLKHNAVKLEPRFSRVPVSGTRPVCSAELLTHCLAGEANAWDALIEQNERAIYRLAFGMCRNHDDASDIVSQVYIKLYTNLHTFNGESSFSVWVHSIVRNAFLDMCVRARWHTRVSLEPPAGWESDEPWLDEFADPGPPPDEECVQHNSSEVLLREVQRLSTDHRQVLKMYVEEGKTYKQISAATGIAVGTVRSRLNRARHSLQDRLTPSRDTLTSA